MTIFPSNFQLQAPITCKLSYIRNHKDFEQYQELLAEMDSAISASNCLTETSLSILFAIHPIVVVRKKSERYECVAGIRTLLIARTILGRDGIAAVNVISNLSKETKSLLVHSSILMSVALHSLKKPHDIGQIFNKTPENVKKELLTPGAQKKAGFARHCAYSYNSIFTEASKIIRG